MAWSFVGAGATTWTTAPSSPLTLPVPAGRQVGDLLVAVICASAAFSTLSPPAGWVLAGQYGTANGSTNVRCYVYYRVLTGAIGSTQAFTRTGSSIVWLGQIFGYRSSTGMAASPLDVVTGNQITASNVTTGTTPGITTAAANELLVAVSFQAANLGPISGIRAATDPATPSTAIAVGAATPTSAPMTGAWTARSAQQSLCSMCVADAVKAAPGATGDFQDTITVAGHAGLLVVAFKPQPPTDALSVGNFDAGPAALGAPALRQVHALGAVALDAGAAVLGAPTLTPVVPLDAADIDAGAAAFDTPAFGQVHVLDAPPFEAGAAVLGQPDGLADYPDVDVHAELSLGRAIVVALTQRHAVGAALAFGRALRATLTLERGI